LDCQLEGNNTGGEEAGGFSIRQSRGAFMAWASWPAALLLLAILGGAFAATVRG
jgi:hypothetical protein